MSLKMMVIVCASGGMLFGLLAALYWLKASTIKFWSGPEHGAKLESQPFRENNAKLAVSGNLNKWAAIYTAISTVLNAASAFLSSMDF